MQIKSVFLYYFVIKWQNICIHAKYLVLLSAEMEICEKMKKWLLYILLFCPAFVVADELQNILNKVYNAEVMPAEKQDSVLGNGERLMVNGERVLKRFRLEYENKHQIYRHSFMADYYVIDTKKKNQRTQIGGGPIRDAVLSPNNRYVVYAKEDNNLYIFKLDYMTEVAVTTQKEGENIFNGISDWLYEEEFGTTCMCAFSPDSKQVAFVRLDEKDVPTFEWQEMLGVQYPKTLSLRYPKAGDVNAKATVCVYDIYYKSIKTMDIGETDNWYIPRLTWTMPEAKGKEPVEPRLIVEKVNRDQNKMEVYSVNPKSTVSQLLYKESSDKYYVDYELFDQWKWLSDGRFVVLSEKDGWLSAYLYSALGTEMKRLTPDGIDVFALYGVNEKAQILYYQAAPTPMTRQCYAVDLKKGGITQLTTEEGMHSLRFNEDLSLAIENFENNTTPNRYTLYEIKGASLKKRQELKNNDAIAAKWAASGLPNKEFLYFVTERKDTLNAWMILPPDFDAHKRYPCVLMQYSGPGSQRVLNRWRKGFGHYLAQQGYVVINSDGRGTNARGRQWRNETYMRLGQKEADDQLSTARFAASLAFVDPERIAIIGWSYGGYQAIRTMSEKEDRLIKCGVAIAPVTDWRLYDTGYTERYMRRPQVNAKGYDQADLKQLASQLQGDLLIIHGLADDNVHAQNTMQYVDALVQAGKQFEMQIYPDDNHFLRKRSNYEHLHRRIMLFLKNKL